MKPWQQLLQLAYEYTVAHTAGGEVTGAIDQSIRHAATKFAHIHFPATKDAKDRIIKLEREEDVILLTVQVDLVDEVLNNKKINESFMNASEVKLTLISLFCISHPVTTEY